MMSWTRPRLVLRSRAMFGTAGRKIVNASWLANIIANNTVSEGQRRTMGSS
jgi:hypothetical protein